MDNYEISTIELPKTIRKKRKRSNIFTRYNFIKNSDDYFMYSQKDITKSSHISKKTIKDIFNSLKKNINTNNIIKLPRRINERVNINTNNIIKLPRRINERVNSKYYIYNNKIIVWLNRKKYCPQHLNLIYSCKKCLNDNISFIEDDIDSLYNIFNEDNLSWNDI